MLKTVKDLLEENRLKIVKAREKYTKDQLYSNFKILAQENVGIRNFYKKELKQEAINDIKLLNDHYESCKEFPFKILNDRERKVLQAYIKWKNNITEEDLE